MTTPKQLSRVAGVPRLKLPIWKAAADAFWTGKGPSRDEQRNKGAKSKVALLRELAATDPAVKSWVIQFATDLRSREARQKAAEQGLQMPDNLALEPSMSVVDKLVMALEAGKELTAEELALPGDPQWDADYKEIMERTKHLGTQAEYEADIARRRRCATPGCPNDYVMDLWGVKMCNEHYQPAAINGPPLASPEPQSPAAYINSGFGKSDPNDNPLEAILANPKDPLYGRALELQAIRQASEDARALSSRYRPGTPMVGPIAPLK